MNQLTHTYIKAWSFSMYSSLTHQIFTYTTAVFYSCLLFFTTVTLVCVKCATKCWHGLHNTLLTILTLWARFYSLLPAAIQVKNNNLFLNNLFMKPNFLVRWHPLHCILLVQQVPISVSFYRHCSRYNTTKAKQRRYYWIDTPPGFWRWHFCDQSV